ncbi:MAG: hypothetical protein ACREB3_10460, partial [Burkholderiales bacterium]
VQMGPAVLAGLTLSSAFACRFRQAGLVQPPAECAGENQRAEGDISPVRAWVEKDTLQGIAGVKDRGKPDLKLPNCPLGAGKIGKKISTLRYGLGFPPT